MPAMPIQPLESATVTILVDNVSDMLMSNQGPAKRPPLIPGGNAPRVKARFLENGEISDPLRAEHGFSALVTVEREGRRHNVLFDAGISPNGVVENMSRMEISPKDLEAIVLSHGHFDHTTGLSGIADALGSPAKLPILIHPEFWSHRRVAFPGRQPFELPATSKPAFQGAGFDIVEERQPSFLLDGSLLVTGEVNRVTDFETGFQHHERHDRGEWKPDPLILDDQAIVMHLQDRGLVILTGCGHAGVINIVRQAKALTGVDDVYAVMGGFHLSGPGFERIIEPTCDALAEIGPQVVAPGHCSGWKASHALARRLPDAFIQNGVGTRYEL